ncbi:helix-turn-helix domain-containing protein [Clostridium perfringens]|uniref:helix-turn-helix domain-containing protein n=1 Tax=Clostridium perfringens TaxID=1502 RepID=UPI00096A2DC6|nr:helix-turn-helix transcriptional regulator [Clostridium perfringens]
MKPYENLKEIRLSKKMSTYELAEKTGIPQSTISKMENGKRKIETDSLELLSKALNVSVGAFFNEDTQANCLKNCFDEDFDEETRAIARGTKNLSPDKKNILKELIKSLSDEADKELNK